MSYIGTIDQGTTSSRFILFDKSGKVVKVAQKEIKQIYEHAGWVSHDAENILNTVYECINEVMSDIDIKEVVSIGITNQRETTVVWDKYTGKPLYHAIVWCDKRTKDIVEELSYLKDDINDITGLILNDYFSAVKLKWMMENINEVKVAIDEKRALFGTIDTWLIWNLTNKKVHITDVTNGSRTMLMDLKLSPGQKHYVKN